MRVIIDQNKCVASGQCVIAAGAAALSRASLLAIPRSGSGSRSARSSQVSMIASVALGSWRLVSPDGALLGEVAPAGAVGDQLGLGRVARVGANVFATLVSALATSK